MTEEEHRPAPEATGASADADKAADRRAFEARRNDRLERLRARATRKREESERAFRAEKAILDVIPLGQPILVGHHSEKRHRRDLERSNRLCRKGLGALHEAEDTERRLDAAQSNRAVSSDDPDAVEKLHAKLERLEAERARAKEINAALRAAARRADKDGLAGDQRRERLAEALRSAGVTSESAIEGALTPDFAGRIGVPDYHLRNLGHEIARVRARAEALRAKQSAGPTEPEVHGEVRIVEEDNRVRVIFPGKPPEHVRTALKRRGFRWSPTAGAWQRHASPAAWHAARVTAETLTAWRDTCLAAKQPEQGDFVEVVRAISDMERGLLGRRFRVARINRTHGYAVCSDEHGSWHLHPEALRILGPEEHVP